MVAAAVVLSLLGAEGRDSDVPNGDAYAINL
jgi:hypothetical protein